MRTIKFRVFHKADGMKYYGDDPIHLTLDGRLWAWGLSTDSPEELQLGRNGYHIMMSTSLKDAEGTEIWGSDVLERNGHLYEVVWYDGGFQAKKLKGELEADYELLGIHRGFYLALYNDTCKVIGNVHEHSDQWNGWAKARIR